MSGHHDPTSNSALKQSPAPSSSQDGGAGPGFIQGVDGVVMAVKANEPFTKGFDKNITGEKGDLNNNLMESMNSVGDKFGGKINAFEGLQSATVNPAAGKSISGPGAGFVPPPNHNALSSPAQTR